MTTRTELENHGLEGDSNYATYLGEMLMGAGMTDRESEESARAEIERLVDLDVLGEDDIDMSTLSTVAVCQD